MARSRPRRAPLPPWDPPAHLPGSIDALKPVRDAPAGQALTAQEHAAVSGDGADHVQLAYAADGRLALQWSPIGEVNAREHFTLKAVLADGRALSLLERDVTYRDKQTSSTRHCPVTSLSQGVSR